KEAGRSVDLIIMDLTIPGGMGGREAVQEILAFDPGAKVIVSSGYSNDPVMSNYRGYGFKAVIFKPYKLQELRKVIDQVLS
ncbi:MAG: response regulator, partial [Desulfobia sp.]